MTCREKLMQEHPNLVDKKLFPGGCDRCPSYYGYLADPFWCWNDDGSHASNEKCTICWDREIPVSTEQRMADLEKKVEELASAEPKVDYVHKEPIHKEDILDLDEIVDKFNAVGLPNIITREDLEKAATYDTERIRAELRKDPDIAPFVKKEPTECTIKDSGARREFETGAVRDIQEGKGRCDLMPLDVVGNLIDDDILLAIGRFVESGGIQHLEDCLEPFRWNYQNRKEYVSTIQNIASYCTSTMFLEVSKHFEEGAKKYGEYNWQKGIPVHCYIDSAVRHYLKFLRGDKDEPHDRAFVWNIMCCIWTCKHKPELNEYGKEKSDDTHRDT